MSITNSGASSGFSEIVESRRSMRIFDQEKAFDHDVVWRCLETATLAPSSSNLQFWEFYRVPKSSALSDPLVKLCMKQKAASSANELVVVVTRRDKHKSRIAANYAYIDDCYKDAEPRKRKQALAYYGKLIPRLYAKYPLWSILKNLIAWFVGLKKPMIREVSETEVRISAHKSVALAAMTFMYAMKAEGYDTCPMEGYDSKRIKALLKLPASAELSMVIACGNGMPEGIYGKRFRIPQSEVIFDR